MANGNEQHNRQNCFYLMDRPELKNNISKIYEEISQINRRLANLEGKLSIIVPNIDKEEKRIFETHNKLGFIDGKIAGILLIVVLAIQIASIVMRFL